MGKLTGTVSELQKIAKNHGYKLDSELTETSLDDKSIINTTQKWKNGHLFAELFIQDSSKGRKCYLTIDTSCPDCMGSGKQGDADLGDIYFNEWTCEKCNGSGVL